MRKTRMGVMAKVDTHAACMERMLHTQDMQPYWPMPVKNCSCLICLLLGKAAFGRGTRDAFGHPYTRPRSRPGYLELPGQWQVQDCSTGEMLWTCKDRRREINVCSYLS